VTCDEPHFLVQVHLNMKILSKALTLKTRIFNSPHVHVRIHFDIHTCSIAWRRYKTNTCDSQHVHIHNIVQICMRSYIIKTKFRIAGICKHIHLVNMWTCIYGQTPVTHGEYKQHVHIHKIVHMRLRSYKSKMKSQIAGVYKHTHSVNLWTCIYGQTHVTHGGT
jgi:hypothetical protein